jgi:Raf kinase inhibitor-like YbhB/YbcL family protein
MGHLFSLLEVCPTIRGSYRCVTYSPQPSGTPASSQRAGRLWPGFRHAWRSTLLGVAVSACLAAMAGTSRAAAPGFVLVSPTVRTGATMPSVNVGSRGSCNGRNQSPPLVWMRPPAGTDSYAVTMADLDAKVGVVWLWLMFNIPSSVTALPQDAASNPSLRPAGAAQARNAFDVVGYLGPCPKKDRIAHHYLITVWALNQAQLPFKDGTPSQPVAIYLRGHALGHANLTPHYGGH